MFKLSEMSKEPSPSQGGETGIKASQNDVQHRLFRESVLKAVDHDHTSDIEGDALFQTDYEMNWTISDQQRLLAIDRLQTRTLEYHNYVHERIMDVALQSTAEDSDTVAQVLLCEPKPLSVQRPFIASKQKLEQVLNNLATSADSQSQSCTAWIHIFDLNEIGTIAKALDMHPLCTACFCDLRSHSNIVQASNGFVVSTCYFQMAATSFDVEMFKLYCYITKGVIVTFVAEIMPETDGAHIALNGGNDNDDGLASNVCSVVFERWEQLTSRGAQLGPMFIFYELLSEAMSQQDSLIEFFSRTLFFFKKKTILSLSHRKKVDFMRKMHIVIQGIQLIFFHIESVGDIVDKLASKAESVAAGSSDTSGGSSIGNSRGSVVMPLIPSTVVGTDQLPYLYDLQDLCAFLKDCLAKENREASVLADAMDSISQLKANNTAMVLSLIATIFLPVTFLTGVFGMNFQVDGGFTIPLVNSQHGPTAFYAMCGLVFVLIVAYFVSKGWIEVHSVQNYLLRVLCGRQSGIYRRYYEDAPDSADIEFLNNTATNTAANRARQNSTRQNSTNHNNGTGAGGSASTKGVIKSPLFIGAGEDNHSIGGGGAGGSSKRRSSSHLLSSRVSSSAESVRKVQEAIAEENRRQAETARKRKVTQDLMKQSARNSTMRFSQLAAGDMMNSGKDNNGKDRQASSQSARGGLPGFPSSKPTGGSAV